MQNNNGILMILCIIVISGLLTTCMPDFDLPYPDESDNEPINESNEKQDTESGSTTTELWGWSLEPVTTGDCEYEDLESLRTFGSDEPNDAHAKPGRIAVCWDGVTYNNKIEHTGEAWCTYKTVQSAADCTGGNNVGKIYEPVNFALDAHESEK